MVSTRNLLFVALIAALFVVSASAASRNTLVLLDSPLIQHSHSIFFNSLRDRGHTLTFVTAQAQETKLENYGEFQYDNLIIFAPTAEDLGIPAEVVVRFIESGRNLLVAVNNKASDAIREIANECGIEFDEQGSVVLDHVLFDRKDKGDHTLVATNNVLRAPGIFGASDIPSAPILFSGIGQAFNQNNFLISSILSGSSTTYSQDPQEQITDFPQSAAQDTVLVSAIQARNNARLAFSGSLDLFSDRFFNSPVEFTYANGTDRSFEKSGNQEFAVELSRWLFQERSLLRIASFKHRIAGSKKVNPSVYTIKDEIKVTVVIEEYDAASDSWKPFTGDDVQLEFTMLDPYVRTFLKNNGDGRCTAVFRAPDVYGVFKFVVSYRRQGYSFLDYSQVVNVRPFRHNQYERFIECAYPYYASSFSMMAGFFLFSLLFLYTK